MICIYHSRDLDGFTSGAIVKRRFPDATLIGFDYGESHIDLFRKIRSGEEVIMIDVSLTMPGMLNLSAHTNHRLTWIDHHISAKKEFDALESPNKKKIKYLYGDGIAACEVGWNYCFPNDPIPTAVKLLGEYDTWRNADKERWDNVVLPFQFGMRQICTSPETFPDALFYEFPVVTDSPVYSIIANGKVILDYQAKTNEWQCRRAAFEHSFGPLRAICLNGGGFNSDVFRSVYDEKKHDIMVPFQFNGKHWTVSLYTTKDDVDCAEIARSWGGGGHRKAAGFQVKDIRVVFDLLYLDR